MTGFLAALQFLTIIPGGRDRPFMPDRMIPFFPLVGLCIGGMLAGFDWAVGNLWSQPVASVLDVFILVFISGALHLDGLGDTADGLYGRRPVDKALAIMKDSRIGTMGVVAIISGLAIKWGGLASISDDRQWLLLLVPAYARASMLFGMRFLPYGRPEGGTGHGFFETPLKLAAFWGLLPLVLLSALMGWRAVWLNLCFGVLVTALLWFYKRRINCITGDMLGAMCEVCESGLFLLISMGGIV
ncbi:MAG: adenosylcobinamide-GDP ribazoletransferase [Desulfobacterales bacterium]|nr:adenosylcobinamide-GDP ribazoletransferase [Desulfobacterales bacterium]